MTAAIIVYILIVTVPLVVAAALTEKLFRLWSLPVRGAWALAALIMVLIGGRTIARQMSTPASVPQIHLTLPAHLPNATSENPSIASVARELITLPRTAAAYVAHVVGPAQSRALTIAWILMSTIVLALICFVYVRVWNARRGWHVTDFAGHRVRVAPHAGPAVVGLLRPEIVVPRWVLESQPEDGQLIVMHEMEHQAAHDPLLLAAMWGLVVLIPWHPGAWYCLARTRLAIELDCDARVVGRGASLRTYAQLLVSQARVRLGAPLHLWLGATSLLEPSSHLERRLHAMIVSNSSAPAQRSITRYLRTLSYVAIVSTITVAACESHVPTADDISGLDVAGAERNARQLSLMDAQHPTYYLNGVEVSADVAKAISPDSIGSISVTKGPTRQEIRIVTALDVKRGNGQPGTVQRAMSSNDVNTMHLQRSANQLSDAIVAGSGADGGTRIVIHGTDSSSKSSKTPLLIVDGVPVSNQGSLSSSSSSGLHTGNALNDIDPKNIESVEVLKGPAAAALYGSRAANGVIIVTTKKH